MRYMGIFLIKMMIPIMSRLMVIVDKEDGMVEIMSL